MPPKAKLELLYTASGTVESNLLVSMLESQGFKVIVIEAGAGAALGITVGSLGRVELYVPPQQLPQARTYLNTILDEMN